MIVAQKRDNNVKKVKVFYFYFDALNAYYYHTETSQIVTSFIVASISLMLDKKRNVLIRSSNRIQTYFLLPFSG